MRPPGAWRPWGDPASDEWGRGKLTHLADTRASSGVPVVWLTYPDVRIPDRQRLGGAYSSR